MARFFCWLLGHRPYPGGVSRHRSIYFHCARCHRLVPGDLSTRRN